MKTAKITTGRRYTPEQKKKILHFVHDYNESHGHGGLAAASKKFDVSYMTMSRWGGPAPKKIGRPSKTKEASPALIRQIKSQSDKLWALLNKLK